MLVRFGSQAADTGIAVNANRCERFHTYSQSGAALVGQTSRCRFRWRLGTRLSSLMVGGATDSMYLYEEECLLTMGSGCVLAPAAAPRGKFFLCPEMTVDTKTF